MKDICKSFCTLSVFYPTHQLGFFQPHRELLRKEVSFSLWMWYHNYTNFLAGRHLREGSLPVLSSVMLGCVQAAVLGWCKRTAALPAQGSGFDGARWCPVNHKAYCKSAYHFTVLSARATREWFVRKKQESRAAEDTWNFREKKYQTMLTDHNRPWNRP